MEAIGTLAGGIAHDFNNLLGIIIGNTELAIDDTPHGSPVKTNLSEIKTASLRARDVVRQLLSFSRKTKNEKKQLYLHTIVEECIKLLRASIPTTIDIKLNISQDPFPIEADPTQIHQVIINLCTNAAQAMEPGGGTLDISLSETSFMSESDKNEDRLRNFVQLMISDSGIGISPENIDKVFDPYFTTKDVGQGTGIGLAVVHGIIKSHDGHISIYSEPGQGTTVKVLLPAVPAANTTDTDVVADIPTGHEAILFVDDEVSIVKMGQNMLEKQGYKVIGECDPKKALKIFRSDPERFDLVITDMTMPKITGEKLAAELREIRPDMPIIISTGFSSRIGGNRIQQIGVNGYLEKPFDRLRLSNTVRNALDRREPAKQG